MLSNLQLLNGSKRQVDKKFQSPWTHSNCLSVAENGADLAQFMSNSTALSGVMNVQSGITSAILLSGCTISQTMTGLVYLSFGCQRNDSS